MVVKDNKILLFKRSETDESNPGKWAMIGGGVDAGETPEEALKRGLALEFGLKLNETIKLEILAPIFLNKGNTAAYHICILPLMEHDYNDFVPTGVQELNMNI